MKNSLLVPISWKMDKKHQRENIFRKKLLWQILDHKCQILFWDLGICKNLSFGKFRNQVDV